VIQSALLHAGLRPPLPSPLSFEEFDHQKNGVVCGAVSSGNFRHFDPENPAPTPDLPRKTDKL
jgi:hypothetical protein